MENGVNRIAALLMAGVLAGCVQDGARGHWSGSAEISKRSLAMEVDLDKTSKGWTGSMSIPGQNASGIPLDAIAFTNGKWTFRMKGAPGNATFRGTIADDGKTMTGGFTQGSSTFPFKFKRTGEPKVEVVKSSPAVAKEFLGNWEGTLEGPSLRLLLKISNDGGAAKGVLISLDRGSEILVSGIDQRDSKLTLVSSMVGGKYEAEINREGTELNGTWTQGGNRLPLKLKRAAAQEKKP